MSVPDPPAPPPDLKNPLLAGVLAWAVPGAGHLYQGRFGKAALYFVVVLGLFLYGWHYSFYRAVYWRYDDTEITYYYFAQIGAGLIAVPPAFLIDPRDPDWRAGLDADHYRGLQINIGIIYTMVAGLLNVLAVFDAVSGPALLAEERELLAERAKGRRPAEPPDPTIPDDEEPDDDDRPAARAGEPAHA